MPTHILKGSHPQGGPYKWWLWLHSFLWHFSLLYCSLSYKAAGSWDTRFPIFVCAVEYGSWVWFLGGKKNLLGIPWGANCLYPPALKYSFPHQMEAYPYWSLPVVGMVLGWSCGMGRHLLMCDRLVILSITPKIATYYCACWDLRVNGMHCFFFLS